MGNRTGLTYPDGRKLVYVPNALGQIQDVQALMTNGWPADETVSYTYYLTGQMDTVTLPNGVVSNYDYDQAGRLSNLAHTREATTLASYHYSYYADGNRKQAVENVRPVDSTASETPTAQPSAEEQNTPTPLETQIAFDGVTPSVESLSEVVSTQSTVDYKYDALNRLTEANYDNGSFFHYQYDSNGNRTVEETSANVPVVSTYDFANRLSTVGNVPYAWDDNGNLTSDGACQYAYDPANRLADISGCAHTASFAYNGLGERNQETVDGVTTTFALDLAGGLSQVLQANTGGQTTTYSYGNERISQETATQTAYFLGDALGSVRQLVDGNGAVSLSKDYEPYGTVLSSTGSAKSIYGYTGEIQKDTLVFLRSRY